MKSAYKNGRGAKFAPRPLNESNKILKLSK